MNKLDLIYRIYNNIPADPPKKTCLIPIKHVDEPKENKLEENDYTEDCCNEDDCKITNDFANRVTAYSIASYILHRSGF